MFKRMYEAVTGTSGETAREPVTYFVVSLTGPQDRYWVASAMVRERKRRVLADRLGFAPRYVNERVIVCAADNPYDAVNDLWHLLDVWDWDVIPDVELRADPHGDVAETVAAIREITAISGWHFREENS